MWRTKRREEGAGVGEVLLGCISRERREGRKGPGQAGPQTTVRLQEESVGGGPALEPVLAPSLARELR